MDKELLLEREAFKKLAMTVPVVEKKVPKIAGKEQSSVSNRKSNTKSSLLHVNAAVSQANTTYLQLKSGSSYRFSIMHKIVKHLKNQFLNLESHPLSLDELLNEIGEEGTIREIKDWLLFIGLPSNLKIRVTCDGLFIYKPPLSCRDKKSLLRLLKIYDMKAKGGILQEDIEDSIPNSERVMKQLEKEIIVVTRMDKKQVIFFNDRGMDMEIREEIKDLWRGVNVATVDVEKIEEYLSKQGLRQLDKADVPSPCLASGKKQKAKRQAKKGKKPKDNDHIADMLEHYDE